MGKQTSQPPSTRSEEAPRPSASARSAASPPSINKRKPPCKPILLKGKSTCYVVFSDGQRRIYRNRDSKVSGSSRILNPKKVSFVNLFVNAVLQPPNHYSVRTGWLKLLTSDIPPQGTPIVLQMIRLYR
ncbi:DUF4183 domain-containing protein [Gorillibacterium sp. CAU 1737]|uniref:DUF4183 domain-containing protein n=1 Tax=Gorillibacterium sp. CAU 1737 TaxID=3140362 RepID=UPI003260B841